MKTAVKKGRAEGIEESKMEIARNLKALGVPIEVIVKSTNLSMEEIEKL